MEHIKNNQINFFGILPLIWMYINPNHKKALYILLTLMLISSVVEVLSVGAVLPFLSVLSSPDQFSESYFVSAIIKAFGIHGSKELTVFFTLIFITAILLSAAIRVMVLWYGTKISYLIGADLSAKMYWKTLSQPYSVHIERNSSEVISAISNKSVSAMLTINGVLTVLSSTLIFSFIFVGMLFINPIVFIIAMTGFGFLYLLVMFFSRRQLKKNAQIISDNSTKSIKYLQEGLGGIRDILIDGSQEIYFQQFNKADLSLRAAQGSNIFISQYPRYAIESIGMVMIAFLALFLIDEQGGLAEAIPILGLLAVGAQRILPILQQVFSAWAAFKGNQASLVEILMYLGQKTSTSENVSEGIAFEFNETILFKDVAFKYQAASVEVLSGINILIMRGSKVGIIGKTGSGKSTFLDILMGLLEPSSGEIYIDSHRISKENRIFWQKNVAHVPQSVYLADSTIKENIAFGVPLEKIDISRVHKVAAQAQLSEFIDGLPLTYETRVGERGAQLSGGQRQRIGIARALYKRAGLIIFDEATSALDEDTENNVMQAINSLDNNLTLVIVAHRLSTLKNCDVIYEILDGALIELSKSTFISTN
jgi:ABC-type bacteriocin/lantibiotic exporter with double-glycine peptidase domain